MTFKLRQLDYIAGNRRSFILNVFNEDRILKTGIYTDEKLSSRDFQSDSIPKIFLLMSVSVVGHKLSFIHGRNSSAEHVERSHFSSIISKISKESYSSLT